VLDLKDRRSAAECKSFTADQGGTKSDGSAAAANAGVLAELASLLAEGHLEIPIAKTYPLTEVREAYQDLEQRHTLGKIVLEP
jgi:NADPH:quinone reductase-like Zn-dependent oxidoreductase